MVITPTFLVKGLELTRWFFCVCYDDQTDQKRLDLKFLTAFYLRVLYLFISVVFLVFFYFNFSCFSSPDLQAPVLQESKPLFSAFNHQCKSG